MSDPLQSSPGQFNSSATTHPSASETLPDDVTEGSLLVAGFAFDTAHGVGYAITDTQGNTWQEAAVFDDPAGELVGIWYAENAKAGATTVTITYTDGDRGFNGLAVNEYAGFGAVDAGAGQAVSFDATVDSGSSGPWDTMQDNELIVGACVNYVSRTVFSGTAFTLRQSVGTGTKLSLEDGQAGTAGTAAATFDASGSTTGAIVGASFVPATSTPTVHGEADVPLGGLSTQATGHRTVHGSVAADLGSIGTAAAGRRTVHGDAAAPLGPMSTNATGHRAIHGNVTVDLGTLTTNAIGNGGEPVPGVQVPDARAHADAVLAVLKAGLPDTIGIYEGAGPPQPDQNVPYVVAYIDLGSPEGYPFCPGRDLALTVSLRGVGKTPKQAQRAAMFARTVMLSGAISVAGRHVKIYQDPEIPPYPERDDTISPPLFGQLVVFDLVSDPA